MGYSGQKCEYATVTIPSYLSEMFQSSNLKELPSIVKVSIRIFKSLILVILNFIKDLKNALKKYRKFIIKNVLKI